MEPKAGSARAQRALVRIGAERGELQLTVLAHTGVGGATLTFVVPPPGSAARKNQDVGSQFLPVAGSPTPGTSGEKRCSSSAPSYFDIPSVLVLNPTAKSGGEDRVAVEADP
jgi:hypothetical protein